MKLPPAFILHLPNRVDRFESFTREFAATSIQPRIIEGVDGKTVPLPDEWKPFGAGAYGCSLGHRKIIETALSEGLEQWLVFEDDVRLVPDFEGRLRALSVIVPKPFDAIFFGGQHSSPAHATHVNGVLRCQATVRTHGFWITAHYAQFLLKTWNLQAGHVDNVWAQYQKNWNCYAAHPWLCGQAGLKSDISGSRPTGEKWWVPRRIIRKDGCGSCQKKAERNVRPNVKPDEKPE